VYVNGDVAGRGTGRTKKAAEQAAAVEACGTLSDSRDA
jgi:dsRNA-specific ribonuclease